ncbi:ATP-binding SpoIIE family protein phosphatase [Streptomyces sp. NPDC046994]|uniref:ATP-binding SpoIIE family protein phosphatase n=1 Tax=Streptomyces sp. NPDC046994 TaxID=3155735 RepID=UPI00345528BB
MRMHAGPGRFDGTDDIHATKPIPLPSAEEPTALPADGRAHVNNRPTAPARHTDRQGAVSGPSTRRRLPWPPVSLLILYLGAVCTVQVSASAGGLVRWSGYSVLLPLVAAALLPVRRTLTIGAATLVASVAVYGFAIRGVSEGGRMVVIASAVLSSALSLVICRARLRLQRQALPPAQAPEHRGSAPFTSNLQQPSDRAARDTPPPWVTYMSPELLSQPAAVELAAWRTATDDTARPPAHWLDVIPLPAARVALVAGSVTKGGSAAPAIAADLRSAVRTLADIDLQPEELLTHLEHVLTRLRPAAVSHSPDAVAAMCLYAVYDPVSARCTLASAGYPAPTVVTPDGTVTTVEVPTSPPLGQAQPHTETTELDLAEGSVLLLHGYTAAAADPPPTDKAVLAKAGLGAQSCLNTICQSALDVLRSQRRYTHAGVLAARTRTFDSSNVAFWDLTADLAAVSQARRNVSQTLAEWGLEDAAPTTELIASELVTNALRHARPPVRLSLILHGTGLTCEVSDGSSTSPHLRRARTFDESGRGLFIVAQLTRRWGTRYNGNGKIIWAEEQLRTSKDAHTDGHTMSAESGS